MTLSVLKMLAFGFMCVTPALILQPVATAPLGAQPTREERANGVDDMVAFAIKNYFHEIRLDAARRRKVDEAVRQHLDSAKTLPTRDERNALLLHRRARLRAILATEKERAQFDRNVVARKLP